jgi:hypothetical protein
MQPVFSVTLTSGTLPVCARGKVLKHFVGGHIGHEPVESQSSDGG